MEMMIHIPILDIGNQKTTGEDKAKRLSSPSCKNPCLTELETNNNIKLNCERRIGTWIVQSLYLPGKEANAVKMKRLTIEILGCSEVRWPNTGHCQ